MKSRLFSTHFLEGKQEAKPSRLISRSIYPKYYATSFLGFLFLRLLRQSSPEMRKPAKDASPSAEKKKKKSHSCKSCISHSPPPAPLQAQTWPRQLHFEHHFLTFLGAPTCSTLKFQRYHHPEHGSHRLPPLQVRVTPKHCFHHSFGKENV